MFKINLIILFMFDLQQENKTSSNSYNRPYLVRQYLIIVVGIKLYNLYLKNGYIYILEKLDIHEIHFSNKNLNASK